jgi:hypothetical protein
MHLAAGMVPTAQVPHEGGGGDGDDGSGAGVLTSGI